MSGNSGCETNCLWRIGSGGEGGGETVVVNVPPCSLSDMMTLLWGRNWVRLEVDLVFGFERGRRCSLGPIKCLQRNVAEYMCFSEPAFHILWLDVSRGCFCHLRSKVTKGSSARIVLSPVDRIAFPRDLTNSGLSQRSGSRFLPCRPGGYPMSEKVDGRPINAGFRGVTQCSGF
jgi:hypothetical protein